MNPKTRMIELDSATAKALEERAAEVGTTVSELVAGLMGLDDSWPKDLEDMRRAGRGPWSPSVLAEDARRYEAFERTREGVPFEEVQAWVQSWGTPNELPKPKTRRL
jgi:hypothetical protein